ncbi:MAG: deoxyribose-phosphate aldolase [Coriobacteriales bacterium]|jgi:deoxyribose-phosphate aldolase|nr:deoxyribose-phosphate aldolase [Coriobacteriales bacterium]
MAAGVINLAATIEHTLLDHDASDIDIDELCSAAIWFGFAAVCVFPEHLTLAHELVANTAVKLVSVVNFPTGDRPLDEVLSTMDSAITAGANEIDYVMNLPAAQAGDWDKVTADIGAVVEKAHSADLTLKVIIEICLFDQPGIVRACQAALAGQADYIKTSTGFSTGGATVEAVKLIRNTVGNQAGIKASGGIRDRDSAVAMLEAGADRLGTSHGLAIIRAMPI